MKKKLLAIAFLVAGSLFGADFSIGIRIGPPPVPRVVRVRPQSPGYGYFWVDGYWYPSGNRYRWREGYWTRPPYDGAIWIGPRYDGGLFFNGYWDTRSRYDRNRRDWDRRR